MRQACRTHPANTRSDELRHRANARGFRNPDLDRRTGFLPGLMTGIEELARDATAASYAELPSEASVGRAQPPVTRFRPLHVTGTVAPHRLANNVRARVELGADDAAGRLAAHAGVLGCAALAAREGVRLPTLVHASMVPRPGYDVSSATGSGPQCALTRCPASDSGALSMPKAADRSRYESARLGGRAARRPLALAAVTSSRPASVSSPGRPRTARRSTDRPSCFSSRCSCALKVA